MSIARPHSSSDEGTHGASTDDGPQMTFEHEAQQQSLAELRKKYPRFIYKGFGLSHIPAALIIRHYFLIEPGLLFVPETRIEGVNWPQIEHLRGRPLESLVFHLGLVEMLSYWKTVCSPEIVIRAGYLSAEQLKWWKDLLLNGMGEFFYTNGIDGWQQDFVTITAEADESPQDLFHVPPKGEEALLMVSGGKDSALSAALLQRWGSRFTPMLLNPPEQAYQVVRSLDGLVPLIIRRKIDPFLLELNDAGYLNGHTPFSAYLAFLGVTVAALLGNREVIASNSSSDDEPNVEYLGRAINHQYSKSLEFELDFQRYTNRYLSADIHYYSLLRPINELQTIRLLGTHPELLYQFVSCNRGNARSHWCRKCAKCASAFALIAGVLGLDLAVRIVGENLYLRMDLLPTFEALLGLTAAKPFECTATTEEIVAAVARSSTETSRRGVALPLLEGLEARIAGQTDLAVLYDRLQQQWGSDANLPPAYARALKTAVQ